MITSLSFMCMSSLSSQSSFDSKGGKKEKAREIEDDGQRRENKEPGETGTVSGGRFLKKKANLEGRDVRQIEFSKIFLV